MGDLLRAAMSVPTVPVQRRMSLGRLVAARAALPVRPSWTAIFTKAFAMVAAGTPDLRRAYVKLPWPHLYEYPQSVASVAVERDDAGGKGVFFGRIKKPDRMALTKLSRTIAQLREVSVDQRKEFRQVRALSGLPWPLRRIAWWLGLNIGRQRANFFGTFTVSVYSGLGAESLHPLSPATTTLNYGVIDRDGTVDVRIIYDHRVMDGATIARALEGLEATLTGDILAELRSLSFSASRAAYADQTIQFSNDEAPRLVSRRAP